MSMLLHKICSLKGFFLFLICSWSIIGQAQNNSSILRTKITISAKSENIIQLLKKVEKQSNVKFIYNPDDLNTQEAITIALKNVKLSYLLDILFEDSKIIYKAKEDQIILYRSNVKKTSDRFPQEMAPEKIILSGYLFDGETGEALIAAFIYNEKNQQSVVTNNFGFFSMTLSAGAQLITFSYLGYSPQELQIDKSQQVNINLFPASNNLSEIVVTAKDEKEEDAVTSSQIGLIRIEANTLNEIPAFGGEQDVLQAITLLPGVKQGAAGHSGFFVRGGGPDQNLILMDGVTMYNPYHLWGYLSTFNPDAINNIELTKGAFPARYGGRLSSVLDITLKDGNNQQWEKKFSAGLLSAKASINGPIIKNKSSIFISARRTVLDLIIAPLAAERGQNYIDKNDYNFGDINFKVNYKLSNKNRVYLSGFYSRDALKITNRFNDKTALKELFKNNRGWENGFLSLRWNHLFNDKLFSNTTAYYSDYHYFSNTREEVESQIDVIPSSISSGQLSSNINDLAIKQDYLWYLNDRNLVRFGGALTKHTFKPSINTLREETGQQTQRYDSPDNSTAATEFGLYVENEFSVGSKLKVNLGLHQSGFITQDTSYLSLQPRLSARYLINQNLSLKMGMARMTQFLHLLTSGSLTSETDLWVPSTKHVAPNEALQYSLGSALKLGNGYELELEGYYKDMANLIEYKDGASFLIAQEGWEEKVVQGKGKSYGFEAFFQKRKGRLTGWLGYSLSWTTRQFEAINFNEPFPYKYDRRHDISVVGNYKLNDKWKLNMTWVFYSGNFVSLATASHINPEFSGEQSFSWWKFLNEQEYLFDINGINPGISENISSRNNFQLPAYHRLDLTATMEWKTKRNNNLAQFTFGLTNAYNKFNADTYSQRYDVIDTPNGQRVQIEYFQHTRFPILPTVNYSLSF